MADDNRISITVDDVEHLVTPGQQLIDALEEAGVPTPHFCYHQDIGVAGNCRICLVEAAGPRGWALAISCHMPVRPGMEIRTDRSSDKVTKARKGVMEFLLVNHPLDCPICDKAGECTLQEHYMSSGRHESRLHDDVGKAYKGAPDYRFTDTRGVERGGKAIDLGPSIVLDQERCIVCTRCVRFMRDVAGEEQLYVAGRGDSAYLTTFPGDPLDHEYDLNTTDICPVGALTGKHFRFKQRVWFLKRTASIVPDDSLGANVWIEHNQGRVWRLMPRRNPDVNKSWISNTSRLTYQRLNDDRLVEAQIDGTPAEIADGVQAAASALKGDGRIAIVTSGHVTIEDNAGALALAEALGERATVFGGSWLSVGEPDGIARSGDPVVNRAGCALLGIPENLDDLVAQVGDFSALVVIGHDLWAADPERAAKLEAIPNRIVLSSWTDATVAKATVALPIRAWAEARGTMVNCQQRLQLLNAAPTCPDPEVETAWLLCCRLAGLAGQAPVGWASEVDAFRFATQRGDALHGLSYRAIPPTGLVLDTGDASTTVTTRAATQEA